MGTLPAANGNHLLSTRGEVETIGLSDKSQKSTGTSTVNYDYKLPPSTPALDKLRSRTFEIDPGIGAQYGAQRQNFLRSFKSPTGAFLSPQVRDMQQTSGLERLGQEQAQAEREGQYDVNKQNYARDVAVAGFEQPQLVNTGGSQSGTVNQSTSPWGSILSAGAQAAPLSL